MSQILPFLARFALKTHPEGCRSLCCRRGNLPARASAPSGKPILTLAAALLLAKRPIMFDTVTAIPRTRISSVERERFRRKRVYFGGARG